jgi:hypothetical protein
VPGARCVARLPGTAHVPLTAADAEIACLVRRHLALSGVMLAGPARLATRSMAWHDAINDGEGLVHQSRPRSAAAPRLAAGVAAAGRPVGRHRGPSGPSSTPVVPDGQWRAVPVRGIAPAGGAARQWSSAGRAGVLPGRFLRSCPSPARIRVPVSQRGARVIARRAGGQSHSSCDARSQSLKAAWPMAARTSRQETGAPGGPRSQAEGEDHDLPHQPVHHQARSER